MYIFKVLYKDFKLCKIKKFYTGKNDLKLSILVNFNKGSHTYDKVDYTPNIMELLKKHYRKDLSWWEGSVFFTSEEIIENIPSLQISSRNFIEIYN